MPLRINNITLSLDEDEGLIFDKAAKKLNMHKSDFKYFKILRESIDARKKEDIKFNYSVEAGFPGDGKGYERFKDVIFEEDIKKERLVFGVKPMIHRPVIVGMGPAGLFAGLIMAQNGYRPIIIERGQKVEERTETVNNFWKSGELNTESNVQFGEGGAGTFSDGKLTTRIKDKRCDFVLEQFINHGAPDEIAYAGKPHIGTDILKNVVISMRREIESLGGEVYFDCKMETLIQKNGFLKGVGTSKGDIACENLILAIGHSSRDTYSMLNNIGVSLTPKPFAIGVRVEHLREMIDFSQYGRHAGHKKLRAADYRLTHTDSISKRGVYSFCMCPGGVVVAAASEQNRLVTNGMSYYKRDQKNSNSAVVVSVSSSDFEGTSPLSGMEFQRHYEELAYKLGGGGFNAPVQLVQDFLKDKKSSRFSKVIPSYAPGVSFQDMRLCLPKVVSDCLKEGFASFDRKIKGFAGEGAVMTGIETRTSAPVRVERNESLESINIEGLYPAGEGAGYAGGIISAAVDGIKCAESIMKKWGSCAS